MSLIDEMMKRQHGVERCANCWGNGCVWCHDIGWVHVPKSKKRDTYKKQHRKLSPSPPAKER